MIARVRISREGVTRKREHKRISLRLWNPSVLNLWWQLCESISVIVRTTKPKKLHVKMWNSNNSWFWCWHGSGRSTGEGIGYPLQYTWASLVAQLVNNPPAMREAWVWSLGCEDPLEKGRLPQSSILARDFQGVT